MKNKYEFRAGYYEWHLIKNGEIIDSIGDFVEDLPEVCSKENLKIFADYLTNLFKEHFDNETWDTTLNFEDKEEGLVCEAIYNSILCYLDS